MKRKILLAFLLMVTMTSSAFASDVVTKNSSQGKPSTWGDHEIILQPPWDKNDHYTKKIQGDVEVTATSSNEDGNADSKCEIGWWGTEEGEAGFSHWFEWVSPITTDSAVIDFNYYFAGEVNMSSSIATGDTAAVKIWFTFFVDDTKVDTVIVDWNVSGGIGDEYTWYGDYVSNHITTSLEQGKTYKFGVESHAYSYATMFLGSYILSESRVSHNQDGDSYVRIAWEDRPPAKPAKPSGQTNINLWHKPDGVKCTYTTSTTDPDMEEIYYQWDFGDTGSTGWLGPYLQGQQVSIEHNWKYVGNFEVKVKAKGSLGWAAESVYSDPLSVTVGYKRSREVSNLVFLKILERFMDQFPLLARLLHNLL